MARGDADALPLAAAELVGVAVDVGLAQSHHLQETDQPRPAFLPVAYAMDVEGFLDDVPHRHARVQRGIGVLEDHLEPPADGLQVILRHVRQVVAFEEDFSRRGSVQLQHGQSQGGLPAAALAHQAEGFAAIDGKGNAVQGPDGAAFLLAAQPFFQFEVLDYVVQLQQRLVQRILQDFNTASRRSRAPRPRPSAPDLPRTGRNGSDTGARTGSRAAAGSGSAVRRRWAPCVP